MAKNKCHKHAQRHTQSHEEGVGNTHEEHQDYQYQHESIIIELMRSLKKTARVEML